MKPPRQWARSLKKAILLPVRGTRVEKWMDARRLVRENKRAPSSTDWKDLFFDLPEHIVHAKHEASTEKEELHAMHEILNHARERIHGFAYMRAGFAARVNDKATAEKLRRLMDRFHRDQVLRFQHLGGHTRLEVKYTKELKEILGKNTRAFIQSYNSAMDSGNAWLHEQAEKK